MISQEIANEIVERFYEYLFEDQYNAGEAFAATLDDVECDDDDTVKQVLIHEVTKLFANVWSKYDAKDDDDLQKIFETFAAFEHIPQDLQNELAEYINTEASNLNEEDDDNQFPDRDGDGHFVDDDEGRNDSDDAAFIYKSQEDFQKLTPKQRLDKVRAWLRRLSTTHLDSRDGKNFLKNLNIGNDKDVYGNRWGEKVQTFDRCSHNYGHDAGSQWQKNERVEMFPQDHRKHFINKVANAFGYSFSHSTPVTNHSDDLILHHHVWSNKAGHVIASFHGSKNWTTKCSPQSGHCHSGNGPKQLADHLRMKAKKYSNTKQEEVIPSAAIMENLLDPAGFEKVRRYAAYLEQNPLRTFGVVDDTPSPAQQLVETARHKAASDKIFNFGKAKSDYSLFDMRRPGKQK